MDAASPTLPAGQPSRTSVASTSDVLTGEDMEQENREKVRKPAASDNRGVELLERYWRSGQEDDLDQALAALEEALATAKDAVERARQLSNLGLALQERYDRLGDVADLERAIAHYEQAVALTPSLSSDLPDYLNHLGLGLRERYERMGVLEDLERAIQAHERAIKTASESSPDAWMYRDNLASDLHDRYLRLGEPDDLDRAVELQEAAVAATPPEAVERPVRLNNLGISLSERAEASGDPAEIDHAIEVLQEAVARTESSAPQRPTWLNNLGNALAARYRRSGRQEDLQRGIEAYRLCCQLGKTASLGEALRAAGNWGAWATERRAWPEATEAYGYGLEVADRLFKVQETRPHKEAWLGELEGLPTDAAYALVMLGHLERAVDVLEQGRALLLAETLEIDTIGQERPWVDQGVAPIAYLVAARAGGVTLVVGAEGDRVVTVLPLAELTEDTVQDKVLDYLDAFYWRRTSPVEWAMAVADVTRWLWDALMDPLLKAVEGLDQVALVPCGSLALLPLHAAWTEDPSMPTGRRYALDETLLTYAPSARALRGARRLAEQVEPASLLVVQEPKPVQGPPLPSAEHERAAACAAFISHARVLCHEQATRDAVIGALTEATVLHLTCHGHVDLSAPLDSALLLSNDEQLSVRDLLGVRLAARLAVLSACETAVPGIELLDEIVSLPTGLLQAGVAGVVASLWSVIDQRTMLLMVDFYRRWGAARDALAPAEALRQAQRWLRDSTNGEKRELFETLLQGGEGTWLPRATAEACFEAVVLEDPDQRSFTDPTGWAAFGYIGA
jgi:CHAT domain-containing protein/tetratricopeptide (TPR) repeat protein